MEPGEWVIVRPFEEIVETLDDRRTTRGLVFMPEMEAFCGQKFRIFKRVETIKLEDTGEVRLLTSPLVSLDRVYCTGEQHEGCDRTCLHLWCEAWLKPIPAGEAMEDFSVSIHCPGHPSEMTSEESQTCNFLASTVIEVSVPTEGTPRGITTRLIRLAKPVYRQVRAMIVSGEPAAPTGAEQIPDIPPLNLEEGDMVEVRSVDEIRATLDGRRRYKGLYFMPEMEKFCGQKFRVITKVTRIKLETTGEMRTLKSPTVFLDGAICQGERHEGCGRGCYHFWKEAWLNRVNDDQSSSGSSQSGISG